MGKLFSLKEWLTVPEAAKHLTLVFGEDVSETDVLRLALDRRLRLSVYFVNVFAAKPVKQTFVDEITKCTKQSIAKGRTEMSPEMAFEHLLCTALEAENIPVEKKYESIISLQGGCWALLFNSCAQAAIEREYQKLTFNKPVKLETPGGLIIKGIYDYYYQVQKFPPLVWMPTEGIITDDMLEASPETELRHDSMFVNGTADLLQFEQAISGAETKRLATGLAHVSSKLATLNEAAVRFWANADRDDRGTHHKNSEVGEWLVGRGFSASLADKAATIIRPEWAPTGRKPEE